MKVLPTQKFLLVRMHDTKTDSELVLPEGAVREPYGEVILAGPDCTFCAVGDLVLFRPENFVAGFDKGVDERFLIPESCVFAKCDPEATQEGVKS